MSIEQEIAKILLEKQAVALNAAGTENHRAGVLRPDRRAESRCDCRNGEFRD